MLFNCKDRPTFLDTHIECARMFLCIFVVLFGLWPIMNGTLCLFIYLFIWCSTIWNGNDLIAWYRRAENSRLFGCLFDSFWCWNFFFFVFLSVCVLLCRLLYSFPFVHFRSTEFSVVFFLSSCFICWINYKSLNRSVSNLVRFFPFSVFLSRLLYVFILLVINSDSEYLKSAFSSASALVFVPIVFFFEISTIIWILVSICWASIKITFLYQIFILIKFSHANGTILLLFQYNPSFGHVRVVFSPSVDSIPFRIQKSFHSTVDLLFRV